MIVFLIAIKGNDQLIDHPQRKYLFPYPNDKADGDTNSCSNKAESINNQSELRCLPKEITEKKYIKLRDCGVVVVIHNLCQSVLGSIPRAGKCVEMLIC